MDLSVNRTGVNRGETTEATRLPKLLGTVLNFPNIAAVASSGPNITRDARPVRMRLIKNDSGVAWLPGQIIAYKTLLAGTAGTNPAAAATAVAHGVVDHCVPAAGVPNGHACWVTEDGPTKFLNDAAGTVTEFNKLVVSSSVAGAVRVQTAAPTQGNEVDQINGLVGQAEEGAAAGGGTLANATSFWGYFKAPFVG